MVRIKGWDFIRRLAFSSVVALAFPIGAQATVCGAENYPFPFTDVGNINDAFCRGILQAYVLGITRGTSATTFDPSANVSRVQMTTFLQRSTDQGLKRNSRRLALGQWWTPRTATTLRGTSLPGSSGQATFCKSDGERIWVAAGTHLASVHRSNGSVQHSDQRSAFIVSVLPVHGYVYFTFTSNTIVRMARVLPQWEPPFGFSQAQGFGLDHPPNNLAFDGDRIWTANFFDGSISIVAFENGAPGYPPDTKTGFTAPLDVVFDGGNMWVSEGGGANRIRKLDQNGDTLQTVVVGAQPSYMVYDGANIWVPNNQDHSVTVVQASTGAVVATIASDAENRLSGPLHAAFDGERVLVTNFNNDSVTLFNAADLRVIGNIQLDSGSKPFGACSDGINLWVVLQGSRQLLRI